MKKIFILLTVAIFIAISFAVGFYVGFSFEYPMQSYYYQVGRNIAFVDENWESNYCYRSSTGIGIGVDVDCSNEYVIIRERSNEKNIYFADGYRYDHDKISDSKTKLKVIENDYENYFILIRSFREEIQLILENEALLEKSEYIFEKSIPTIELRLDGEGCKKIDSLEELDWIKIRMSFSEPFFKLLYEKSAAETIMSASLSFFHTSLNYDSLLPNDLIDYVII